MTPIDDIKAERARQNERWGTVEERRMWERMVERGNLSALLLRFGNVRFDDCLERGLERAARDNCAAMWQSHNYGTFADLLLEEVFEALAAPTPEKMREELVQVGALAVFGIESLDAEAREAAAKREGEPC